MMYKSPHMTHHRGSQIGFFITGGILELRSMLRRSQKPFSNELPPTTITLLYKLWITGYTQHTHTWCPTQHNVGLYSLTNKAVSDETTQTKHNSKRANNAKCSKT